MSDYDGRMEYERRKMEERRENSRCGWCGAYVDIGNGQCAEQGPPCKPHEQHLFEKMMQEQIMQQQEDEWYENNPHEGEG